MKCTDNEFSTNDSLLDKYAEREKFKNEIPDIMNCNLVDFVSKYKVKGNKLEKQSSNVVPKFFQHFQQTPGGGEL